MSPKSIKKKPSYVLREMLDHIEDCIFDHVIHLDEEYLPALIHQRELLVNELEVRRV
jgi:hypothetical protein